MLAWWRCTITRPTPMTTKMDFHTEHINTNTWVCFVSFILCQCIVTVAHLTAWLKSWAVSVIHLIRMRSWCVRFTLAIDLSFLFTFLPLAPSIALFPLPHLEPRRVPVHSAQKEYGLHWRDLLPHKLWAQRLRLQGDLSRVQHRALDLAAVLLRQRTPSTMTPHSRICCVKLTEYMSITLNEKSCLTVSRRRPCPNERGDLLESERGDLLNRLVRS